MELKIGVIGTGAIGEEHIKRFTREITGCKVVALSDIHVENAKRVAAEYGAEFFLTGEEVIFNEEVDAVVIASWDQTHAHYVKECIKAGKYVFCEKPLATKIEECEEIMEAEINGGKRLVQVGFMRRYDPGYVKMKEVIESGKIGKPLLVHACHRNKTHAATMTTDMSVKNSGIHEIDIMRWLLGEDYKSGMVLQGKSNGTSEEGLEDPQMMILQTKSGVYIDVEINQNSGYGYDIQCEVVGEKGTVRLPEPSSITTRVDGSCAFGIEPGWETRFIEAYHIEFQQWVKEVKAGAITGPTSWDGYVACVTADTLGKARVEKNQKDITLRKCPEFYQ